MLKFIWGKGHQPTAERLKVQKELFGFSKAVQHGFPSKPSSLAFDPELRLLALGTKSGLLRVYGRPGVEFYGEHEDDVNVSKIVFLPGQGRLVTLTDDNSLHLWQINDTILQEKKSANLEGRLKRISVLCLDSSNKRILLGTEGGNVYFLNLWNFKIDENIIYQDVVVQNAPADFKVNPGAVEALLLHPAESEKVLIGYARGLIAIWNRHNESVVDTYVASQQLESLAWRNDGSQFVSAHNDGSYVFWSLGNPDPVDLPSTPYGPYPCKAISKIFWSHQNGTSWMLFCGGMPRASYGDKNTVTVMKGEEKHTVFDLTSKVADFVVILEEESNTPNCMLILSEEELVAIDLTDDSWPAHSLPYLNPIHASAITCVSHITNIDPAVYKKVCAAGKIERGTSVSEKPWPIDGGVIQEESDNASVQNSHQVLMTGHEDGSVKFWDCSGLSLTPMATVKTKIFFVGDDLDEPNEEEEEEWPPFRKVGHFDPYSDDPRLAVKKVAFCGKSGRLIVGGTAGQVVILDLGETELEDVLLHCVKADLVTEKEGFTWKGHNPLTMRSNAIKIPSGFQPNSILQISPPASINSIGFSTEWNLVAAGTAHGLAIFDGLQKISVLSKCTLNAQDIANADDNPMSRRKSLKKSLRESFRRLRKGRSQRNFGKKKTNLVSDPIKRELRSESPEARPVERAVEARTGSEDGLGSMVRCLHFAHTFIANPQTISATLWAGTNSGQVLVFLLNMPMGEEKRKTDKTSAMLAKEIQLKHKAPVITIQVLDAGGVPIPVPSGSTDETTQPHRVLITSEEQFKLFLLPTLKPCGKYKLTAHEGSRIRRVGFVTFPSKSDPEYSENCFTCLTNQGDLAIHSLPELRRQVVQTRCIRKEDVIAIASLVFSPTGEAFYQCSSSEFQRVSVAAANHLKPKGVIVLTDSAARYEIMDNELEKKVLTTVTDETKDKASGDVAEAANADPTVARQNHLSEKQPAQGLKSPTTNGGGGGGGDRQEVINPKDPHNDTTVSDISADITMDSVKDHTLIHHPPEVVVTDTACSSSSTSALVTKVEEKVDEMITKTTVTESKVITQVSDGSVVVQETSESRTQTECKEESKRSTINGEEGSHQ